MADSTPTRRRLLEAAWAVLAEEKVTSLSISFPLADGHTLVVEAVRLAGMPVRKDITPMPSLPEAGKWADAR